MLQTKKEIGPEAAKQSYHLMIKNYELAIKMDPSDGAIRKEYDKMVALFGTKAQEATPQLEISGVQFEEVFSAMYKFYTENPIGKIKVTNRSQVKIDRFWAELTIKDYMDYPSESPRYHVMEPGEEKTLTLFAVFNNRILEFTEDTPLNAQINLKFIAGGKEYTVSKKQALNLYNRNALIWDDPRKLASFVTAKDNAVKIFAREIIQQFRFAQFNAINANLQKALQLFNALGVYGMTYIADPKTPFKAFSKLKHAVDYVQYPRDALRFKNGDCDDLSALYASLLENLGIETALVLVPEHILMLFNTGVPESKAQEVSQDQANLVFLNGKVWIPVETTLLGKSFLEAWEAGARKITQHQNENQVLILETSQASSRYAPVSLPPSAWEPSIPPKEQVERGFFGDINKLIDRELTQKIRYWEKELQKKPQDAIILNKIGIIYGRFEKYSEAITYFQKSLHASPAYFSPQNNLGNVYFLQKKYEIALLAYEKALKINPENPLLLINLALIHKELGQNEKFKSQLEAAFKLNQRLREQYSYLLEPSQTRASQGLSPAQNMHWIEN
ncbi:MAG: hypothetical protein CVV50_01585 [Spirochaetae bacterium HGW-Spirochaetae-6]|nr:MAG: hypothetical protein CVV50_01585 [Spirochaetae bacterium HGW-Spirochaetae-6]